MQLERFLAFDASHVYFGVIAHIGTCPEMIKMEIGSWRKTQREFAVTIVIVKIS